MQQRGKSSFVPVFKKSSLLETASEYYDTISNISDYGDMQDYPGYQQFNPKSYFWLFNPDLKFDKRTGFCINEDIKANDYLKMRDINRRNLTKFLKRVVRNKKSTIQDPSRLLDTYDSMSTDKDYQTDKNLSLSQAPTLSKQGSMSEQKPITNKISIEDVDMEGDSDDENLHGAQWDDQAIDIHAKDFMKDRRNGKYIPDDVVAHLEFFYNTLLLSNKSENPFENPKAYPGLLFQEDESPETLFERHRKIIFPSNSSTDNKDSLISFESPLPQKKYSWYMNHMIEDSTVYSSSPSPKKGGSRRGSEFKLQIKSFNAQEASNMSPIKDQRRMTQCLNPIPEFAEFEDI